MTKIALDTDIMNWAVNGLTATPEAAKEALREGRPLLVIMHGYGSFEGDLIRLAPQLPSEFVCVSPRAPGEAPAPIENGYTWFVPSLKAEGLSEQDIAQIAMNSAGAVIDCLDNLETEIGRDISEIVLMGFSQGGAMTMTLFRMQPTRFVAGVNCSGVITPGHFNGDAELSRVQPPLFWGRDEADPIIAQESIDLTSAWVTDHVSLESKLYPGIAHSISAAEVEDISVFLRRHVKTLSQVFDA